MASSEFAGQVAVITGGAGGIGLAVATEIAKRGGAVCLVDLKAAELQTGKASLEGAVPANAGVMTHACDVGSPEATAAAVQAVLGRFRRIDVLVQAAGITGITNTPTENVDPANFDLVMKINVKGIFLM
jgi:2-dehydro-3-deoxy-L-rhamnonate dehydrogenase (NAD+)